MTPISAGYSINAGFSNGVKWQRHIALGETILRQLPNRNADATPRYTDTGIGMGDRRESF